MAVYRTAPKCPECGEKIKGKYWQPEVFFCGDTFTGWDWARHRCRLGIKYFIERTDTHEWYYDNMHDNVFERTIGWTSSPIMAMMFDTKEDAEKYLLESFIPPRIIVEITEHEFVPIEK